MDGVSYASTILLRAVKLDHDGKYTESLVCYQEGIHILLDALKNMKDKDEGDKAKIRAKVEEYMNRAEKVKGHIEKLKNAGNYREQMQIEEGATGYSYEKIFSKFLDHSVRHVEIDDPYIRSAHQCDNFLRFVELCVRQCPNLKNVRLRTKPDDNHIEQEKRLGTICKSVQNLPARSVKIDIEYSDVLHDREIRLDNGWVIKIGRGLDYFKPVDRFCLGWNDFYFRPCKSTTVDIFHNKDLQKC